MGLLGILIGLLLLVWLAFRGWSVLVLAPAAALVAAAFGGQPLLASWTQIFMGSAATFLAQFFPLFLLGAVFGKLMEDSGSVTTVASFMTGALGKSRAMLAVVLAGAAVTYGGVSLFVAFFVLAPMAQTLFRAAAIPGKLMPAAIILGTSTFIVAAIIMLGFGLWWLHRAEQAARRRGESFGAETSAQPDAAADDEHVRERATAAREFDPAEIHRGHQSETTPSILVAALPLGVVVAVNLAMSFIVLPRLDSSFLSEERFGGTSITAVAGVWSVVVALAAAIVVVVVCNRGRLPALRQSVDAGANASALPALSVASLVGFGAVVAALPAFAAGRDWVVGIEGGPLVSLAVATNVLAALTGSASGGLTIALDALGTTYMKLAAETGVSPALMHRVAVIGAGTLDLLPHNGAVVSLLAICGVSHRQGYMDIVMVGIVSAIIALVAVIALGSAFGSF